MPRASLIKANGYSILELVVVLAGLSLLTSLAATRIQTELANLEMDEGLVHLNSLGLECLEMLREDEAWAKSTPPKPASLDTSLLNTIGYKKNINHDNCIFLQIDPIEKNKSNLPTLGFGIFNNKLTKFGVIGEESPLSTEAAALCKRWAGDKCVSKSFDKYFYHMYKVFHKRFDCENKFAKGLKTNPPPPGNTLDRWDGTKSQGCARKSPEQNTTDSYNNPTCTYNACTKKAYVLEGRFVGYKESDLSSAQNTACSNSIIEYINSSEGMSKVLTDLENCPGKTIYICNFMQHSDIDSYKACRIDKAIEKCKLNLEEIRLQSPNGAHRVEGEGLPPCGQKVWVCNKTIYETLPKYRLTECFTRPSQLELQHRAKLAISPTRPVI